MRRSRIVLTLFAVPAALVLVVAVLLLGVVRLSWFERQAGEWLSGRLGTTVTVDSLALGYFPAPSVALRGLTVAADDAPQASPLFVLGKARVVLPWRALLGGPVRATHVELMAPQLALGVDEGGRGNWEPLARRLAELGGDEPSAWWIGALQVEEGAVTYADARDATTFELTGVTVSATDLAPATYFPLTLRLAGHGPDVVLHASIQAEVMLDPDHDRYAARALEYRGWLGGLGLHIGGAELAGSVEALQADLAAWTAVLEGVGFDGFGVQLDGRAGVTGLDADLRMAFELHTEPFAPRALANALNRPLPATTDPAALARASATARGEYTGGSLVLEHVEAGFDDTRVTGRLVLPAEGTPQVRLEFDRIDLDRYLPPEAQAAGAPAATLESLLGDLAAVDVDADLRFGAATSAGVTARGLRIRIEPSGAGPGP